MPTLPRLRVPDSPLLPPPLAPTVAAAAVGSQQAQCQRQTDRLPIEDRWQEEQQQQHQQQQSASSWREGREGKGLQSPMASLSSPLGSAAFSRSLSPPEQQGGRHDDLWCHEPAMEAAQEGAGSRRWAALAREARK